MAGLVPWPKLTCVVRGNQFTGEGVLKLALLFVWYALFYLQTNWMWSRCVKYNWNWSRWVKFYEDIDVQNWKRWVKTWKFLWILNFENETDESNFEREKLEKDESKPEKFLWILNKIEKKISQDFGEFFSKTCVPHYLLVKNIKVSIIMSTSLKTWG